MELPNTSFEALEISNNTQLKKFYSLWSINASKLIQQYAKDNSLQWYNTKWRKKSKEIPFYIRTKAPKSFIGNIWMMSGSVNYAYAKDAPKYPYKYKPFPKGIHKKPVNAGGKWFTPKKYKPDIKNINLSGSNIEFSNSRCFASKTSHNKWNVYKKPLVWYQDKTYNIVGPVALEFQLADEIIEDASTYRLITEAFEQTVEERKYF